MFSLSLLACSPIEHFEEYEGVNLIEAYDFDTIDDNGNGWYTDHGWDAAAESSRSTSPNDYMIFEPLSPADLSAAQAASGYDDLLEANGGTAPAMYRLEILNQFSNGDFENTATPIATVDDISGAGYWGSSQTVGDDLLFVDTDASNYLEFDTDGTNTLYADLGMILTTFNDAANQPYTVHMDFVQRGGETIKFQFDDAAADEFSTSKYRTILPQRQQGDAINYPGNYKESTANTWFEESGYNRLYFGSSDGEQQVFLNVDNIRFIRSDVEYAARLMVPLENAFSETDRPDLASGGMYTFSVYVRKDPDTSSKANRFHSSSISLGIRGIGDSQYTRRTVIQERTLNTPDSWTKVELSATNLVNQFSEDENDYVLELMIIPSATGVDQELLEDGEIVSIHRLDAGSIILARPSLIYTAEY